MKYKEISVKDLTKEFLLQPDVVVVPKDYDTLFELYLFLRKIMHSFMLTSTNKKLIESTLKFKFDCAMDSKNYKFIGNIRKHLNFGNLDLNGINVPDIKHLWWSDIEYYEKNDLDPKKYKIYLLTLPDDYETDFDGEFLSYLCKQNSILTDNEIETFRDIASKISLGKFKDEIPSEKEVVEKLKDAFKIFKEKGSEFNPDLKLEEIPNIECIKSVKSSSEVRYTLRLTLDYQKDNLIEIIDECLCWKNLEAQTLDYIKYEYKYEMNKDSGDISNAMSKVILNGKYNEKLGIGIKKEEYTILEFVVTFTAFQDLLYTHPQIFFKGKKLEIVDPTKFKNNN